MTKENLIKLLEAMSDNCYDCHKAFKADRQWKFAATYMGEHMAFDLVLSLLTDPDFAKSIWEIFFPEEVMT